MKKPMTLNTGLGKILINQKRKKKKTFWIFLFKTLNDIYLAAPMQIVIILMVQGNIEMYFKRLMVLLNIKNYQAINCLKIQKN